MTHTRHPITLLCIFASITLIALTGCDTTLAPKAGPPNVVFILADDMGWGELGCYGQEKIRTPHIDTLATQGMRFTQNYSGAPVCAPCRDVLLTGRHLGHSDIRGNRPAQNEAGKTIEGQWPIEAEVVTMAEVFQQAGYATGAMGKWGLGAMGSSGDPLSQGFDHFYGYNCQRVAHSFYPPHIWNDSEAITINSNPVPGHAQQPEGEVKMEDWFDEQYASELVLKDALEFIDNNKDAPFFLYLPFIEPHVSMHPPRELVESYPAEWDTRPYRGESGYIPHPRPRAGYAAMITDLDNHVGAVMAKLKEHGLADNTIVIFTSDNGTTYPTNRDPDFGIGGVDAKFFNSTRNLRGYKGSVHEGGLRTPLIVRWPGRIAENTVSDLATYFPDQFATLCDAVALTVPETVDGISILPTLTGKGEQTPRNPMVWIYPEYGGQVALRLGDWKLVRKNLKNAKKTGPWELYNITEDIEEANNVAAQHPEIVAQGIEVLRQEIDSNPTWPMTVPGVNSQSL